MPMLRLFQINQFLLITMFCNIVLASFVYNSTLHGYRTIFLDVGGFKIELDPDKRTSLSHVQGGSEINMPDYLSALKRYQEGMKTIKLAVLNFKSNNWKKEINKTHVNFLAFLYTIEGLTKDIRTLGWRYHENSYKTLASKYARLGVNVPETAAKIVTCYMDQANERIGRMTSLLGNNLVRPVCNPSKKTKPQTPPDIPDCCQYLLHAIIQMSTNLGPDVDYLLSFNNIPKKQLKKLQALIPIISKDPVKFVENGKKELEPFLKWNLKFQETYFREDNCVPLFGDKTVFKKKSFE